MLFRSGRCHLKVCTCPNGISTTFTQADADNGGASTACTTHGLLSCKSCAAGFHLLGSSCVANSCSCPNGTPVKGAACPVDGVTPGCESCAPKNLVSFGANGKAGNVTIQQLTGSSWSKLALKHCHASRLFPSSNPSGVYGTKDAAEAACLANADCSGVWDNGCDNTGFWYQCSAAALGG